MLLRSLLLGGLLLLGRALFGLLVGLLSLFVLHLSLYLQLSPASVPGGGAPVPA
mgnify:CR=1 FL=1